MDNRLPPLDEVLPGVVVAHLHSLELPAVVARLLIVREVNLEINNEFLLIKKRER
jgi:hypothetical protein